VERTHAAYFLQTICILIVLPSFIKLQLVQQLLVGRLQTHRFTDTVLTKHIDSRPQRTHNSNERITMDYKQSLTLYSEYDSEGSNCG